jgi:hypothetical protein
MGEAGGGEGVGEGADRVARMERCEIRDLTGTGPRITLRSIRATGLPAWLYA